MEVTKTNKPSTPKHRENLLTTWKKECDALSSPLHINPVYARGVVDAIHGTLKDFFGLKYFAPAAAGTPLENVSWLHTLLANPSDAGSFIALTDIARLTLYAATLGPSFTETLKNLRRNPDNLRSYYFELYTYRLLDKNGVPNIKKPLEAKQELEGVCTLLGNEYLFECRKLYLPGAVELDVRMAILHELQRQLPGFGRKAQAGMGAIITVKLADPVNKKNKQIFSRKVAEFIKRANAHTGFSSIDYEDSDEHGTLRVMNYSIEKAIEIKQGEKYDVYVILYPAAAPLPDQPVHHRVGANITHFVSQDKIMAKLAATLKEKRRQHKTSNRAGRIYFFDNEILPEFRMSLFGQSAMLEEVGIQALMDKGKDNDALCIITRNYRDAGAGTSMRVFCKPTNGALKATLETLVFA